MSNSPNSSASVADFASVDSALLRTTLAAQKDDYLRLAADFDNFKKRTRRDSEQRAAADKDSFIQDLLPILDNLERAVAWEKSSSSEALRMGVEMTLKQLRRLLHSNGIEAVEALGQTFDPHRHEAVAVAHDPRQPDDIVLEVVQRGYCRGDKVFRSAKVIVNDLGQSPGAGQAR